MICEYTITARSQMGTNSDCGRALERVAFFRGVTHAQVLARDEDSITIGYNGRRPLNAQRDFRAELDAEGLVADAALWDPGSEMNRAHYARLLRNEALSPAEPLVLTSAVGSPLAGAG